MYVLSMRPPEDGDTQQKWYSAMALKHFTRIPFQVSDTSPTCALVNNEGYRSDAYDAFEKHLLDRGHPYTTRKRYGEAVARFLDYLTERGAFGTIVTNAILNAAVDEYPGFLKLASRHPDPVLAKYADAIGFTAD
jgi:hypothetical protein